MTVPIPDTDFLVLASNNLLLILDLSDNGRELARAEISEGPIVCLTAGYLPQIPEQPAKPGVS